MIDIHAHILPGVDDGAGDIYDTLEMASMAAESGVTAIVATPHCNIPGVYRNYYGEEYKSICRETDRILRHEGIPVKLLPGMEAYATVDLPELIAKQKITTLNQSHYMLIEFDFHEEPDFADDILHRVSEMGIKPVIAHAERYDFVLDNPEIVYEWRKKKYLIQANKGSFQGRFGGEIRHAAYRLLDHRLINVIASDAHSPYKRTPFMLNVYDELCMQYPQEVMDILFRKNPDRICSDLPVLAWEPIPFYEY